MSRQFQRIGAVAFGLWGALHVAGGALMLSAANLRNSTAFFEMSAPQERVGTNELPGAAFAVFAARSIDLIWIGVLIALLAWRFNWRGTSHWWLAPLIVLAVEASLILSTINPGFMTYGQASPGLVLAVVGIGCAIVGRERTTAGSARAAVSS